LKNRYPGIECKDNLYGNLKVLQLPADVINGDMKLRIEVWVHTNHAGISGRYFTDYVLLVFLLRHFVREITCKKKSI